MLKNRRRPDILNLIAARKIILLELFTNFWLHSGYIEYTFLQAIKVTKDECRQEG